MDDDKNIIEKAIEAVKDIAHVASEAAKHAMEPEPIKPDEELVVIPAPLSISDDFISPMPPIAVVKKKQKKSAVDTSGRITPAYDFPVPSTPLLTKKKAKKASRKPAKTKAKKAVKKSKPKAAKKTAKKTAKKSAKKRAAKKWKSPAKGAEKKTKQSGNEAVEKKKKSKR